MESAYQDDQTGQSGLCPTTTTAGPGRAPSSLFSRRLSRPRPSERASHSSGARRCRPPPSCRSQVRFTSHLLKFSAPPRRPKNRSLAIAGAYVSGSIVLHVSIRTHARTQTRRSNSYYHKEVVACIVYVPVNVAIRRDAVRYEKLTAQAGTPHTYASPDSQTIRAA